MVSREEDRRQLRVEQIRFDATGVPADKIRICPLGYRKVSQAEVDRRQYQRGRLRVLWLGTLCLRKGIVYAIEAASRLKKRGVDFTFTGPLDVRLPALPSNCRYIGKTPRVGVGELYASHDIFILPTLSDGFAITQLEAMAHGLPVVATPNCGEVVEQGVSGLVVPPRDSRALANAIMEIGEDPHKLEQMSLAALKRSEDFRPDRVWRTYESHLVC